MLSKVSKIPTQLGKSRTAGRKISHAVALPGNYDDILRRNGFRLHNYWAKSFKKIEGQVVIPETDFTIEELRLEDIEKFETTIRDSFMFDNEAHLVMSRTYKRPGWFHYLVKESGKPVAAASLFVCGKYASLAIGGRLPEARGKGVQNALIARRINDAYKEGCEYIIVETSHDTDENPSPSFRNMMRNGFELAYLRPNDIYEF